MRSANSSFEQSGRILSHTRGDSSAVATLARRSVLRKFRKAEHANSMGKSRSMAARGTLPHNEFTQREGKSRHCCGFTACTPQPGVPFDEHRLGQTLLARQPGDFGIVETHLARPAATGAASLAWNL